MTANALQGDRELCVAAGMDDYVSKPIRIEELVGALGRCRWRPEVGAPAADAGAGNAPPRPHPLPTGSPMGSGEGPPHSAGPESAAAPAVIDRLTFDRLTATMGRAFVVELIDTFGEDARELIGTLRQALAETDVDTFRRAAHSLKSTSETVGATGLAGLARELESMARTGHLDGTDGRLEQLVGSHEIVTHALEELRRDLST